MCHGRYLQRHRCDRRSRGREAQRAASTVRTLTVHDLIASGMSRRTAYRRIERGMAAKSLTIATEMVTGGNGAKQPRRVVVLTDDT